VGLNLHAIVSNVISSVNPPAAGLLYVYTGSTKNPDYTRTANYATSSVTVQVQPLGSNDLRQLAAMNITGVTRKAYLSGSIQGVNRAAQTGGALLQFPVNGVTQTWLVTAVIEPFDQAGWCSVGLTEQVSQPG
jgi:hypothetical protein